jgi:hypothetical protein
MSNTITHKRLVNAMVKAGMIVTPMEDRRTNPGYIAKNPKNGVQVQWYTQAAFVPAKDGKEAYWDANIPITTHVTWCSPHTDSMTDCFCDSYYDTIKSAVAALQRDH